MYQIPVFKLQYTVYPILKAPVYRIPKNPGLPCIVERRDRAVLKFFFKTVPNCIEHTAVRQEEMNILKINIYISVTATNE